MLPPDGLKLGVGLYSPASNKTRAPRLKANRRLGVNLLSSHAANRVSRSRTERARRAYLP
jgi:hypothetical protein